MSERRVTIYDIAQRSGRSAATVSRVLSGSGDAVSEQTRLEVVAAAQELGYRPNRIASNLRRKRTKVIGVVVSDISNLHFAQMVRAVEDAAYRRGYRVVLCNTDESPRKQHDYLEVLEGERVVGVILVPSDPGSADVGRLVDQGVAVIAFDRPVTDARVPAIVIDNEGAGARAAEHLLARGHRDLGIVGAFELTTGAERRAGFERAVLAAGGRAHAELGGTTIEQGADAARRLLAGHPEITAVVAASNMMTAGVLQALQASGRRAPDDIALVGFDEAFWSELVGVTTMAQPIREMAASAVEHLLFNAGDGEAGHPPERVVFDFSLVVRQSCGGQFTTKEET